jgi:hypothetical protein
LRGEVIQALVRQRRAALDAEARQPATRPPTPAHSPPDPAKAAIAVGFGLGLFFIVRAVAEPFAIDWGGPSLLGVLLVHCGPGVMAAVAIAMVLIRRRSSGRAQPEQRGQP